jgi:WD40 repeat protein
MGVSRFGVLLVLHTLLFMSACKEEVARAPRFKKAPATSTVRPEKVESQNSASSARKEGASPSLAPRRFVGAPERVDAAGDPLPHGALARLGSLNLMHEVRIEHLAVAGEILVSAGPQASVRLWNRSNGQPVGPPLPHTNAVSAIALSHDARWLAVGSVDGVLRLWDLSKLALLAERKDASTAVRALAFDATTERLAVAWEGAALELLDRRLSTLQMASSEQVVTEPSTEARGKRASRQDAAASDDAATPEESKQDIVLFRELRFSPTEASLLFGLDEQGAVHRLELETGARRVLYAQAAQGSHQLAMSPDGQLLALSGKIVSVFDAQSLDRRLELETGQALSVSDVAFSPDGATLVSAHQGSLRVWDARSGALRDRIGLGAGIASALVFVGEQSVAVAFENEIRFFDIASGRPEQLPQRHRSELTAMAVSVDGERLATVGMDGRALLWGLSDGKLLATLELDHALTGVCFSGDSLLLVGPFVGLLRWDGAAVTGTSLSDVGAWSVVCAQDRQALVLHADGQLRLYRDDQVMVLDAAWLDEIRLDSLWPRQQWALAEQSGTLAVAIPAATAGRAGVWVGSLDSPRGARHLDVPNVQELTLSSDGRFLALLAHEPEAAPAPLPDEPDGVAPDLAQGLDDASAGASELQPGLAEARTETVARLLLIELESGEEQRLACSEGLRGLRFSPDGALLAATDGTQLRLFEREPLRERFRLFGEQQVLTTLLFLPDAQRLVAASGAGTALLWDLEPLRRYLAPLQESQEVVNP